MAVLAIISSPNTDGAPDSTPRRIVSELPAVDIDVLNIDREGTTAIPYVLVRNVSTDEFAAVLADDPRITAFDLLERADEGAFYRAEWEVDSPVLHCVERTDGVVIDASGSAAEWRLKVWFEDGSAASDFQQCCIDRAVPMDVRRLESLTDVLSRCSRTVSPRQREAMILAYRAGYFDEPRRISQAELADRLDISSSALGRRLRRGFGNLVEKALLD